MVVDLKRDVALIKKSFMEELELRDEFIFRMFRTTRKVTKRQHPEVTVYPDNPVNPINKRWRKKW